ncbi:MAG: hypothetical protein H6710_13000 [Myxococcales bacterium]|nr:hypothetical protein [Myxococcales bacterium]MCB9705332.1 hypothetical protein [Myxococcales bacterium]
MTLGHFFYIPGVLVLGLVIGYVLGGRAAVAQSADRDERDARKAARRARQAAREGERPGA